VFGVLFVGKSYDVVPLERAEQTFHPYPLTGFMDLANFVPAFSAYHFYFCGIGVE